MASRELRTQRVSWRVYGALFPHSMVTSITPSAHIAVLLTLARVSAVFTLQLGIILFGGLGIPLGIGAALVLPALYIHAMASAGMWWATGAGLPTLVIRDGLVLGRVRPVAPGQPKNGDGPDDPHWWDFEVPATRLAAHRSPLGRSGPPE